MKAPFSDYLKLRRYDPIQRFDQGGVGLGEMMETEDGEYVSAEAFEAVLEALHRIAMSDDQSPHGNGMCRFGCDCPWIAQEALASIDGKEANATESLGNVARDIEKGATQIDLLAHRLACAAPERRLAWKLLNVRSQLHFLAEEISKPEEYA